MDLWIHQKLWYLGVRDHCNFQVDGYHSNISRELHLAIRHLFHVVMSERWHLMPHRLLRQTLTWSSHGYHQVMPFFSLACRRGVKRLEIHRLVPADGSWYPVRLMNALRNSSPLVTGRSLRSNHNVIGRSASTWHHDDEMKSHTFRNRFLFPAPWGPITTDGPDGGELKYKVKIFCSCGLSIWRPCTPDRGSRRFARTASFCLQGACR